MCTSTFCLPLFLACTNIESYMLFNHIKSVCRMPELSFTAKRFVCGCKVLLSSLICISSQHVQSQQQVSQREQVSESKTLHQQADLGNGMQRLNHTTSRNSKPCHITLYETGTYSTASNLYYSLHHPLLHEMLFSLLFINLYKKTLEQCII